MNGLIFDIKKFAVHDGPGIRTTVFFKGCPLNCRWCHNPESRSSKIESAPASGSSSRTGPCTTVIGRNVTAAEVMLEICKDKIFYDHSGGGVTFSGGEPMMQVEFLATILADCKNHGIKTAIDTSGHVEQSAFEKVIELTDLFLYDIKLADSISHEEQVGVDNSTILDNLRFLLDRNARVEIRIPMIPDVTDTRGNLEAIADLLAASGPVSGISLLPYNRLSDDKRARLKFEQNFRDVPSQSMELISSRAEIFRRRGHRVAIGG